MKRIILAVLLMPVMGYGQEAEVKGGVVKSTEAAVLKCEPSPKLSELIKKSEEAVKGLKSEGIYLISEALSGEEFAMSKIALNEELLCAVRDKGIDWRVRYYLLSAKVSTADKASVKKHIGDMLEIAKDKNEREELRCVAVMSLIDIYKEEEAVKVGLTQLSRSSDTPNRVLRCAMSVIGESGMDDADAIMDKVYHPIKELNDLGINLNAINALGKSKDPRAFGYLIKIYDESGIDSFFHVTAIETMWYFVKDPERREMARPVIVPRLLKLMDDRVHNGVSRDEAAQILAYLQVKEAAEPIRRWFLPVYDSEKVLAECKIKVLEKYKQIRHEEYSKCINEFEKEAKDPYKYGGNIMDISVGSRVLTQLGDKSAIPVLEQYLENFDKDIRGGSLEWRKEFIGRGNKFPEDSPDYKYVKNCLKALKGGKVIRDLYDDDGIEREKWLKQIYGRKK